MYICENCAELIYIYVNTDKTIIDCPNCKKEVLLSRRNNELAALFINAYHEKILKRGIK